MTLVAKEYVHGTSSLVGREGVRIPFLPTGLERLEVQRTYRGIIWL